jgi:hypothetical protein
MSRSFRRSKCEPRRETAYFACKMLNARREAAALQPSQRFGKPYISRLQTAANAGSVTGSFAALLAIGCEQNRAITNSAFGTM